MNKNKIEIVSKNSQDEEITVYVVRPMAKENSLAQKAANLAFSEAIDSGALFRKQLNEHMKSKGLWDDERDKELEKIDKEIEDKVKILKSGGVKLNAAKQIAIEIRQSRFKRALLLAERTRLDEYTVEGQVENTRFDTLVSLCTYDKEGNKIFTDLEDYRNKSDELYAMKAASTLANLVYDIDSDWEKNLPENEFLKKYNFVDDKLQLVNKDGKFINIDGKLIDEDGFLLNENGERVDENGQRLDEKGLPIVEFSPFLDDDGNPVG